MEGEWKVVPSMQLSTSQ